jgi:hypothetical protein
MMEMNGRWNSNDVQSGDAQVDVDVQAACPPNLVTFPESEQQRPSSGTPPTLVQLPSPLKRIQGMCLM